MSAIYKNGIAYGGAVSAANLISATDADGSATNVQAELDTINENISSLNGSLSNCATKAELADCVWMMFVTVQLPANSGNVGATARVPSGYSFVGWCYCSSVGWIGHVYPATNDATTTFYTSSGVSSSTRKFNAFYLVRNVIST